MMHPVGHPRVELRNVGKAYGEVAAVRNIWLEIDTGTLVTLLGPSGCGKTSTLRLIAGLEHPTSGRILIDGQDVTHLSAAERDVSMVFQSYALFPHMNVLDNTTYGLLASGMKRRDAEASAAVKLKAVGLSGFERRLPSELSGGQQQRVAVARAIVLEPKVLLFDEPLSNLDARLRRQVRDDIRALQQELGLTVVYVTHDQDEALAVSDRIVVMQGGLIVQDGTPRDLYERPSNRFIADFIGNANLIPVTVLSCDGDLATIALGTFQMKLPHRGISAGPALIAVRPHAIEVARENPASPFRGCICKAAYLGGHMEYAVAIETVQAEVFVIDSRVHTPLVAGDIVDVAIALADTALVPASG